MWRVSLLTEVFMYVRSTAPSFTKLSFLKIWPMVTFLADDYVSRTGDGTESRLRRKAYVSPLELEK
jgi:hypothetical protein